ncbi:uncharacterized protein [Diadema antillarum]|uniref:uncharacterized protein n=1 Tax=Diadema antillarum TaxID=105358 RepID=UPI003A8520E4
MVAMDGLQSLRDERARYNDPYDQRYNSTWEGASLKPFRTKDEYLYAMREDLAEWLSNLYDLEILPESFFDRLENGALLCQHANNVRRFAIDFKGRHFPDNGDMDIVHGIFVNNDDLRFKRDAKAGTFLARDNVSNFIHWCRHSLRINEVLLFESDDLVLRKNDKSFILCLLEVARRGGPIGMPVPMLVQLEQEIDRELNGGTPSEPDSYTSTEPASPSSATTTDVEPESEADSEGKPMDYSSSPEPSPQRKGSLIPRTICKPRSRHSSSKKKQEPDPEGNVEPPKRIMLTAEVLKTLDELVRDELQRCSCPVQFPMIREAEGKYRIGDSNTLIFVRILRKHVMVRVGGGWDTLTHYLDKHDPCRCDVHKKGSRRSTAGADFGPRSPKRRSSVNPSDVRDALNGESSPTENGSSKSNSPSVSPRHSLSLDVRPRSAILSPSRRQSTGDTSRPNSLNLSVRNSPRPLRRGNSFDTSPRVVTSPDSSDTYSNPDVGELPVTPTKESTLKRSHGRVMSATRKISPDSDSTTCSEPVTRLSSTRRRNSAKNVPTGSNRTSQTATEEFLRRKRQQAQSHEAVVRSAPTSPTRRRNAPHFGNQRSSGRSRDLARRAVAGAAEERRSEGERARESRSLSLAGTRLPMSRDLSMSPSLNRRSSTPGGLTRKARPQSAKAGEDRRRLSKTTEPVLMITRNDNGRHRLDSTSSCESNDSSVKSGSRSLTGAPMSKIPESNFNSKSRVRSVSVDRTKGTSEKLGAAGERRRSLFDRAQTDRKKPIERSSSNRRKPSIERPVVNVQKERVRSDKVQTRSRSLSRDWQTGSLKLPRTGSSKRAPSGASASASSSPVRRRRSDIPPSVHIFPDAYDRLEDGSISSGASSPRGGASSRSRLKPPTAIPPHLKPDHSAMTSIRKDNRDGPPTRIPLPTSHKRLLETQERSRSNSLPSILADLLEAWQSVQNSTNELTAMDPFDMSPCLSSGGESVSPTSSIRTAPELQNDSGYEDNANMKLSPNFVNHLPVLPSPDPDN